MAEWFRRVVLEVWPSFVRTFWAWPEGLPRTRWLRALRVLFVLAALVVGSVAFDVLANDGAASVVSIPIAVISAGPLALVPYRPLMAWRLGWIGLVYAALAYDMSGQWPWNPVQIVVLLIVLLAVAYQQAIDVVLWVAAATLAQLVVFVVWEHLPGTALLVLGVLMLGYQSGRRLQVQRLLKIEEERSEQEHAKRAVLEERTRIARELHDVVAHHLSMITVRAQTAPYRIAMSPEAKAELTELGGDAREALTEMRRLLGVLRSADPVLERVPQPGIDMLDTLLTGAREAGVEVTVEVTGDQVLPAGVSLTAYRIVQEALSNATRHAPGAPLLVAVGRHPGHLDLVVRNGPAADQSTVAGGSGLGLVGMRERVAAVGGELTAGPTANGGWEVRARLPFDDD